MDCSGNISRLNVVFKVQLCDVLLIAYWQSFPADYFASVNVFYIVNWPLDRIAAKKIAAIFVRLQSLCVLQYVIKT